MENQQVRQTAPHSVAGMVLGILSIVLSCGFVGLILGIIGLVQSKKAQAALAANPELGGAGFAKAGKICSIVGIIIGAIAIVYWIIYFAVIIPAAIDSVDAYNYDYLYY